MEFWSSQIPNFTFLEIFKCQNFRILNFTLLHKIKILQWLRYLIMLICRSLLCLRATRERTCDSGIGIGRFSSGQNRTTKPSVSCIRNTMQTLEVLDYLTLLAFLITLKWNRKKADSKNRSPHSKRFKSEIDLNHKSALNRLPWLPLLLLSFPLSLFHLPAFTRTCVSFVCASIKVNERASSRRHIRSYSCT